MGSRKKIGVFLADARPTPQRLLDALTYLLSVEFVQLNDPDNAHCAAAFLIGASREQALDVGARGLRCLAYIGAQTAPVSPSPPNVHLTSTSYLPRCFRGRTLFDKGIHHVCRLKEERGDDVVARKGDNILWVHTPAGADLVTMELPHLADADYLFEYFEADNWVRLLPILHFLLQVSAWESPPLRACFMFDDPNLHWKSYGYIEYQKLARHALEHNYHASFATVPMDSWYVHRGAAALFRENKNRLSFLIHGNDHTYFELIQARTDASRQALAAQALRRIERLERLSGLGVPRVMAAPHGACDHDMANVLLRMGFEAACISRSSLMVRNANAIWPISVGLNQAEFLGGGLPIIPRFNIRWDSTFALFAAFLGQPIIPVGHHEDLAGGLGLLEQWADLINSLGEVQWADVKSIAQTNFWTRREGDVLEVKMYSRKIQLKIPQGVTHLRIKRPWLNGNGGEGLSLRKGGPDCETISSYQGEPVSVLQGEEIEIGSIPPDMIDPRRIPISRSSLWGIARRQLCEGRDRLRPSFDRLFASKTKRR